MIVPPKAKWVGPVIPEWLSDKRKVSTNAKVLYAQLCYLSTDYGVTFVTLDALAEKTALTLRAVSRAMHELEAEKLIDKRRVGLNQSNQYRFPDHEWMEATSSDVIKISDYKDTNNDRAKRLPTDFRLSSDTYSWAIDEVGKDTTLKELEHFKDYWWSKGGSSATKVNWQLAFKNWIRNHIKFNAKKSGGFKRGSDVREERQSAITAALASRMADQ